MGEAVFYPRSIDTQLVEALTDSPAVLIHGPRQCGKTTLAQFVCAPNHFTWRGQPLDAPSSGRGYAYINFEAEVARNAARADPAGFVDDLPERVVLDEVQRVPDLFAAIKVAIDRRREPGRFVLTGSTNVLLIPALADSLAGRLQIVRLHPLSQSELVGASTRDAAANQRPGFLDALFGGGFKVTTAERLGRQLAGRIAAGGYPAALARPAGQRRARWYRDYADTLVQRDVRDIARIARLDSLARLLEMASGQTARLLNVNGLAAPFQLSRPTIADYLTLLERLFLVDRLPPWHDNRLKRLIKTPKLHMGDTGLACALIGADADALTADRHLLGQMLETFVFQELRRQASWHNTPLRFFHFRDKDGTEVDIVIERGAAHVVGIEVKAAATVTRSDFRGLRKLASASGERFVGGVVLYDGETSAGFGDRMYAVPIRHLWENL